MTRPSMTLGALLLGAALAAAPAGASASGATLLEERFKSALNGVVRQVRAEEDPAAKRAALVGFADRMDQGLARALESGSLAETDRASLASVRAKFVAYRDELRGEAGLARVEDADLDAFAAYVQQDLEQAPVGGGIYISAGALIVILVLLLLLL